jgi:hypothetical protein
VFKDDHSVAAPPRRRWRFWLPLLGVSVLAFTTSVVIWVVWTNGDLQAAIAEADRLDPRWRLEEIEADRFTPPPGQNATDKIVAIQRHMPADWWRGSINVFRSLGALPPERQLDTDLIASTKDLLGPAGAALAEARSLVDTPLGRHPYVFAPDHVGAVLPHLAGNRTAISLLHLDVYVRAQSGDADGAIRSCHAAFHSGCSIGDEPFISSQNARIACQMDAIIMLERALAQGEPSDGVLAALQARIESEEPKPLLLYSLRGERAGRHQFFEAIRAGTLPTNSAISVLHIGMAARREIECRFNVPGLILVEQTSHLHCITELIEIAKLPPEQWDEPLAAQRTNLSQLPILARQFLGSVKSVFQSFQRNHALLRCAVVAIAAERYRRANGQWPATPDDLVEIGLIKSVPTDPFAAGGSIKFARPADGLIVYSIGQDAKDNGGKLEPLGWPPDRSGTDYGFRLWDVAARRQPPLPPKAEDKL